MERRSWTAPILMAIGLLALLVAATMDLVLGLDGTMKDVRVLDVLRGVSLVVGSLLLSAGMALGWMRGTGPRGACLRWYTLLLAVLGFLALGSAALYDVVPTGGDPATQSAFLFTQRILGGIGILLLSAATLRLYRSRLAFPVTAAAGLSMLLCVPIGTILGIVWLVVVEPAERRIPGAERAVPSAA